MSAHLAFSPSVVDALNRSGVEVIVTGASGWLGRATLEMLESALGPVGVRHLVTTYGSRRRILHLRSGTQVTVHPLDELQSEASDRPYLLAHYAFLTRELTEGLPLRDYLDRNERIRELVLTRAMSTPPSGLFMASSGAVYQPDGTLETDVARNPYGALKVIDERKFSALLTQSRNDMRIAILRIFNLAGPFLNKVERYALGSILLDIGRGGPIRISASRPVIRSYMHVRDVIDLAFAIMLRLVEQPAQPVDTAGEKEVEIGQLARVAREVLAASTLQIERPAVHGAANRYVGDGRAVMELATTLRVPLATLQEQVRDTADYLCISGPRSASGRETG